MRSRRLDQMGQQSGSRVDNASLELRGWFALRLLQLGNLWLVVAHWRHMAENGGHSVPLMSCIGSVLACFRGRCSSAHSASACDRAQSHRETCPAGAGPPRAGSP